MRPRGTPEQLAVRRTQARKLLKAGHTPTEVARRIGVARQTIYRWKVRGKRKRQGRLVRPPGPICRVTPAQQKQLRGLLLQGALEHGYAEDYWTLARVGQVLAEQFQIRYVPSGVWHLLRRMHWSNQKPQRIGFERNDRRVARWQKKTWVRLRRGWLVRQATLVFLDEKGFSFIAILEEII